MGVQGVVRNGLIQFPTDLPEGTRIDLSDFPMVIKPPPKRKAMSPAVDPVYRLYELAVDMGIPDLAAEHDHYLYGTPKRYAGKKNGDVKPSKRSPRTGKARKKRA